MSIIKRKAGSEDIVKSILEFDAVPTEGSPNLVESGAVAQAIGNLGQPLQWKGPATVSELNTGITGIQPGWTYTLTDAGTLTDGSVKVDVGDEVAWTEDGEWFKVGGENNVKIFKYSYSDGAWQYPSISDVNSAAVAGKVVYLCENTPAGKTYYQLTYRGSGSGNITVEFVNAETGLFIKGYLPNGGSDSWTRESSSLLQNFAPDYSALTFPILEGTQCVMLGGYFYANQDIATTEAWTPAHWTQTSVAAQIATIGPNGVFIGSRKIHPGSKLFVEGLPVDSVDYALVEKYNAFIYNRITALATSGTVTLGLWNYDTKTYVSEQQFSTDSDNPTVIDVSAANASDTMEIHLKGTGTIDSIVGSIV